MTASLNGAKPVASVVIPTRDRAVELARNLPSIAQQQLSGPYEVIVVDNGSRDSTVHVANEAMARWPCIRLISELQPGAGRARCAGALAARSPLLIFIDDDMAINDDVVAKHVEIHRASPGGVVLGNIVSVPSRHPFERMMAYIYDGPRSTLSTREPTAEDCWSGHISIERELFLNFGGFDDALADYGAEDFEFGLRLAAARIPMKFAANAVAHHRFTARFGGALRRSYRNGVAYGYIFQKHPGVAIPGVTHRRGRLGLYGIELACRAIAAVLELFSRHEGVPFTPLTFIYNQGLRVAIQRGVADYKAGNIQFNGLSLKGGFVGGHSRE